MITSQGPSPVQYTSLPSEEGGAPMAYAYRDARGPPIVTHHPIPYHVTGNPDGSYRRGYLLTGALVALLLTVAVLLGTVVGLASKQEGLRELIGLQQQQQSGNLHYNNPDPSYSGQPSSRDNNAGGYESSYSSLYDATKDTATGNDHPKDPYSGDDISKDSNWSSDEDDSSESEEEKSEMEGSGNSWKANNYYNVRETTTKPSTEFWSYWFSSTKKPDVWYNYNNVDISNKTSDQPSVETATEKTENFNVLDYTTIKYDWPADNSGDGSYTTLDSNYVVEGSGGNGDGKWWLTTEYYPEDDQAAVDGTDPYDTNMGLVDYMVVMQRRVPVSVVLALLVMVVALTVLMLGSIVWMVRRRSFATKRREHVRRAIDDLQANDKSGLLASDDEEV